MIKTGKPFLSEDFLLENETAFSLYQRFAASAPIIDFHNHLSPKDIIENRQFHNLTEIWLEGDHYKWRAMRSNGVNESIVRDQPLRKRNFKNGPRQFPTPCGTPFFTGHI
jgi:glucuronate isomerase